MLTPDERYHTPTDLIVRCECGWVLRSHNWLWLYIEHALHACLRPPHGSQSGQDTPGTVVPLRREGK